MCSVPRGSQSPNCTANPPKNGQKTGGGPQNIDLCRRGPQKPNCIANTPKLHIAINKGDLPCVSHFGQIGGVHGTST